VTLKTGSKPVTSHAPDMSCNWPFRCPLSPSRQLWQIGRSGCERSLTHQSTDIEQHAHSTAMSESVGRYLAPLLVSPSHPITGSERGHGMGGCPEPTLNVPPSRQGGSLVGPVGSLPGRTPEVENRIDGKRLTVILSVIEQPNGVIQEEALCHLLR
jgi:hypothetical protein